MGRGVFVVTVNFVMKIKLIRGCIVSGHPNIQLGDIVEVPDGVGSMLCGLKKAERVCNETPPVIETRDPVVENRDPIVPIETLPERSFRRKRTK